jgi:hypothetical protein
MPGPKNFDRGLQAMERGDYETAYRFLESPSPGTESEVLQIMRTNQKIPEAGTLTFSTTALTESVNRYGRPQAFIIEHSRLQRFAVYSGSDVFKTAAENLALTFPKELAFYYEKEAEKARVAGLPETEQQKYWAESFSRSVEAATIRGIVISAQMIDKSGPGTSTGSQLGSAIGQAAYIDNASWSNYRGTNQIAAGIIGAIIGSSADTKATVAYQKVYFIRTSSGELRRIDEQTSDPILLPTGACLEYREPFHLVFVKDSMCSK